MKQLVNQRKVPFEINAPSATPTDETRRAMVAAEAKALGLMPDDSPSFNDFEQLFSYLED